MRHSRGATIIPLFAAALGLAFPINASRCSANAAEAVAGDASVGNVDSWPRTLTTADAGVTIYMPQIESFQGDQVTGRAAVAVTRTGSAGPTFGAMQFAAEISTDRENRTVTLVDLRVTTSQFRSADAELGKVLESTLKQGAPGAELTFPLDELLTQLDVATRENAAADELKNDPPKIVVSDVPAMLVLYDGPPKLMSVEESPLMRVANTPSAVWFDPAAKLYFLDAGRGWYSAADPLGPWQVTEALSTDLMAMQDKLKQVAASQPSDEDASPTTQPDEPAAGPPPTILTATEPTELIVVDGPPRLATLYGTNLLYATNTDSDVFLDISTQKVYLLLAGRWYVADRKEGPWSYVAADKLPPDFARISPDSPKGNVLPSVAGTEAAQEAVLDALIPQTAEVDRSAPGPTVTYDGEPQFESIQQNPVSYAVNTPDSVLKVDAGYYLCSQGVWYQSAAPVGPWVVCVAVPNVIYTIPPSCPVYSVKYVRVYSYSPTIVHVGYTPGYMGCYVYGGTVVFGTGFVYRGWSGRYYYPRPTTYGFAVRYNGYTGSWGFAVGSRNGWVAVGGRGGGPGFVAGGTWGGGYRGSAGWWGAGGYRRNDINITINNNFNRNVNVGNRSQNIYANRSDAGKSVFTRNDGSSIPRNLPARTNDARTPGQGRTFENRGAGQSPRPAALPSPADRNLFTDKNGDVVRRGLDGWESRNQANPKIPQRTSPGPVDPARAQQLQNARQQRPDLDRQLQARERGQQRAQDFQQYRSQAQSRPAASGQNRPAASGQNRPAAGQRPQGAGAGRGSR